MKTERIEIAQGQAITLPIYFRSGDKIQAYFPATKDKPGRYPEVSISLNMVASWNFADAPRVISEVTGKEDVTRDVFEAAFTVAIENLQKTINP